MTSNIICYAQSMVCHGLVDLLRCTSGPTALGGRPPIVGTSEDQQEEEVGYADKSASGQNIRSRDTHQRQSRRYLAQGLWPMLRLP